MKISIQFSNYKFMAELHDTPTGNLIYESLPFETSANTWGDEIYFDVSANAKLEPGAQAEVEVGDLAYWPPMPAFCIFFGATPVSSGIQPVAASAVNVFGKLDSVDIKKLRSIKNGENVKIEKV